MDLDLFERTCRAPGLQTPPENYEGECFDADGPEEVEEEMLSEFDQEKLEYEHMNRELECMKRRIQILQLQIKAKQKDEVQEEEDICTGKAPCPDLEDLLKLSKNKEICDVQKAQHKMQCQINELVECLKVARDQIKDLRLHLCDAAKDIFGLQKMMSKMEEWRLKLDEEFGICIERFEYLKHVKAEWSEIENRFDELKQLIEEKVEGLVTVPCFSREKVSVHSSLADLMHMYDGLMRIVYKVQKKQDIQEVIETRRTVQLAKEAERVARAAAAAKAIAEDMSPTDSLNQPKPVYYN